MLKRSISVFVIIAMLSLLFASLGTVGAEEMELPDITVGSVEIETQEAAENGMADALNISGNKDINKEVVSAEEPVSSESGEDNNTASESTAALADNNGAATTFDFSKYDFSDPSKRNPDFPSDEQFFGVWDESKGDFKIKGHINYDYVSKYGYNLLDVLEAVKKGDYETAKAEILKYYQRVTDARGLNDIVSDNRQAKLKSDLMLQNFHYNPGGGEVADIFYFTKDYTTVNVPMTDQVQRIQSLGGEKQMNVIVFAVNKDDYEAEMVSKDNPSGGPELEVVVNGTAITFKPKYDGYVGAGENRNTCFAASDPSRLLARESSIAQLNPVDSDTRRSYIMFDLSKINDSDEVSSATLRLQGRWVDKAEPQRNNPNYQKRMTIMVNQECSWTEAGGMTDSLCYSNSNSQSYAFSYDGEFGTQWRQPDTEANPAFRFEEELFRFSSWFDQLTITYKTTGDETYARAAFMFLHDFIEKTYSIYRGMPGTIYEKPAGDGNSKRLLYGGYSKGLDLHSRSSALPLWLPHLYKSEYMTPELFTVFLKYIWSMGKVHSQYWTSSEDGNWGTAATTGFFRTMCYYPEFAETEEWNEILMKRLENFNNTLLREDRSSKEGSLAYTNYTISTLMRNKAAADDVGVEYNISDKLKDCIVDHAKFMIRMSGPGLTDSQYGDGSAYTTDYYGYIQQIGDWLKDPEVLWAAYKGKKGGKEPDFTSYFYPNAKQLTMRSGWTDDALFLYTNAKAADSFHEHWDDLAVVVSAYGEYLLADPLHNTYNANDMNRRWLVSSRGHNTIEMNGHCQKSMNPSGMDTCLPLGGKQGDFQRMELNDSYDFTKIVSENYKNMSYRFDPSVQEMNPPVPTEVEPGMDNSRSILFVRPNFWIVSDYMDPVDKTKVQKYEQLWHMKPGSDITIDGQYQLQPGESIGKVDGGELDTQIENTQFVPGTGNGTIRSNNVSKPNILIVPTDIETTEPKILRGLYAVNGLTRTTYATIEKNVQGKTGMDTILFPTRANQDYKIDTTPLKLNDLPQGAGSSFKAHVKDISGVSNEEYNFTYYILHEEDKQTDVRFGDYKTDGTLSYYQTSPDNMPSRAITQMGTYLEDKTNGYGIFKASDPITDLAIEWNKDEIKLTTSKPIDLAALNLTILALKNVNSVTLNGKAVDYKTNQKYIYFGEKPLLEGSTIVPNPDDDKDNNNNNSNNNSNNNKPSHGISGGGGGSYPSNPITPVNPVEPVDPNAALKAELEGHWGQQEIAELIDKGVVKGTNGTLALTTNVTRAEFTVMLLRAFGMQETPYKNSFQDVKGEDWFAGYLQTAVDNEILIGSDGYADPDGLLTREQAVKIMIKAMETQQEIQYTDNRSDFADGDSISDWARPFVDTAVSMGLIKGLEDNRFMPQANTPREQAMVMVYRTLNKLEK